jgi:hypothetical protein
MLKTLNLTVTFLLELVALVVFTAWGFQIAQDWPLKIVLGLGAPALMIVFWARFMAPRSPGRLQDPWHLLFEIVIFGLAVLALLSIGRSDFAVILAIVIILSIGLSFPLKQRPGDPAPQILS